MKSSEEIMEILEAHGLTGSLRDAAELAGRSHHSVKRHVEAREKAGPSIPPVRREQLIDPFLAKVEEWVDRSQGKVRADRVHARLVWLGHTSSERTTPRTTVDRLRHHIHVGQTSGDSVRLIQALTGKG